MKKYTMEEAKNKLLSQLDLEGRSILFHIYEINGEMLVGSGIIGDHMDLEESNRFYDYAYEHDLTPDFCADDVTTYCLGDGESEDADCDECAIIENLLCDPFCRQALLEYFETEVECVNSIPHLEVNNPHYVDSSDWFEEDIWDYVKDDDE